MKNYFIFITLFVSIFFKFSPEDLLSLRRVRTGYVSLEEIVNVFLNIGLYRKDAIEIGSKVIQHLNPEFRKEIIIQLRNYPQFYKFLYRKSNSVSGFVNEVLFILSKLIGFKKALEFYPESRSQKEVVVDIGCGKMEYFAALDYVFNPGKILGIDQLKDRVKFAKSLEKILAKTNPQRGYKVVHSNIEDISKYIEGDKADVVLMLYPTFFGYGIEKPSLIGNFESINEILKDKSIIIFGIPANEKERYEPYISWFKKGSKDYIEYEIPVYYLLNDKHGSYYFLVFGKKGIEYTLGILQKESTVVEAPICLH